VKKDSLWNESPLGDFPPLRGEISVDVLVVGGGITGITTAYLLKEAGCRVAVIDQQSIGGGETAHTTAHLTMVTDARLHELVKTIGHDAARAFWEAGLAAIEQIRALVTAREIDCDFQDTPGYLFAATDKPEESDSLREDARLAKEFGFDVDGGGTDPLFGRPAIRFANQARFHPLRYLDVLAKAIPGAGSHVFSKTSANGLDAARHELQTERGVIRYETLIAATHVPIQGERGAVGAALFQTKLAAYSTYAIAAGIDDAPDALFWDTRDPYHYWRLGRGDDESAVMILGGEDHKTGQQDNTEGCYARLEEQLRKKFPRARVTHRWSGQVIETPDGLPFIGEIDERQFLATGFSGNGMTLGTFAAMLIRDRVIGAANPFAGLFDPHRKQITSAWTYLRENKDFPLHFLKERLASPEKLEDVKRTTGAIVKIDGRKRAVYCDEHGKRTILSPVCPHMGCLVVWNAAEKTWDCPCHGSRFMSSGGLMAGPAESGLEKIDP